MNAVTTDDPTAFGVLRLPKQIIFGPGAINQLPITALGYGPRVLVCCDPFLATTSAWQRVCAALIDAGATVEVLTDVVAELPLDSVERSAHDTVAYRPDVIVGFGGGSSLDLAKLLALLHTHRGNLRDYYGEHTVPGPVTPLIAIPTTSGTGSEVTPVAVISDPERTLKVGISSSHLIPDVALVDPELTLGAPKSVTAHAGIDAFVHAIEAFTAITHTPSWSRPLPAFVGRNGLSNLLAAEAITLIGSSLPRAVHHPDDRLARAAMARGSLLAGMAFGTGGTHLSHAIQYAIGALTRTPHGLGTGLLLPYVLQASLPSIQSELARIAELLGVAEATDAGSAQAAVDHIHRLIDRIDIPANLAEIGVERQQLSQIVEMTRSVRRLAENAPLPPTKELITAIVTAAWKGDRAMLHHPVRALP